MKETHIEKNTTTGDEAHDYLSSLAGRHLQTAERKTIKSVCITSNSMDYSGTYMFSIDKVEGKWFFSCDAVVDDDRICVGEKVLQIDESDAEEVLAVVREQQFVSRVIQYEEPEDDGTFALDETTRGMSFVLADDSRIYAPVDPGPELTDAFCRIAKRYQ